MKRMKCLYKVRVRNGKEGTMFHAVEKCCIESLTNYIHRRQCTWIIWIIDSDLLPSETYCGNFCVLRHPPVCKWICICWPTLCCNRKLRLSLISLRPCPPPWEEKFSLPHTLSSARMEINAGIFSCRSIFKKDGPRRMVKDERSVIVLYEWMLKK